MAEHMAAHHYRTPIRRAGEEPDERLRQIMHQMLAVASHKQAQEQLQCETTAALLVNVPGHIVRRSLQKTAVTTNSHTVHRNQELIIAAMDPQIARPNQELVIVAACAARGRGQFPMKLQARSDRGLNCAQTQKSQMQQ